MQCRSMMRLVSRLEVERLRQNQSLTVASKAVTSIVHSKIGEGANAAQRRTGESRDDH